MEEWTRLRHRVGRLVKSRSRSQGSSDPFREALMGAVTQAPGASWEVLARVLGCPVEPVRETLAQWGVRDREAREGLPRRAKRGATLLEALLGAESPGREGFDELRGEVSDSRSPLCLALWILRGLPEASGEPLREVRLLGQGLDEREARSFLKVLLEILGEERGFLPRGSRTDGGTSPRPRGDRRREARRSEVPSVPAAPLVPVPTEPEPPSPLGSLQDPSWLLEVAQRQLAALEEEMALLRETALRDGVLSFLRELNAPRWGGVLDQLGAAERQVRVLRAQGAFPPDLESLGTTVRLVMRCLRGLGLRERLVPGSVEEMGVEETRGFLYEGSEFRDGERKVLEVGNPGWVFRGESVAPPLVREVVRREA